MRFVAIALREQERAPWDTITHIRLIEGQKPHTALAIKRWETLRSLADEQGIVDVGRAIDALKPVREKTTGREAAIKYDLRFWANPRSHGNNSLDKGWLELGYLGA